MYKWPDFEEKDERNMIAFMKEHSFATVIGMTEQYPEASHFPVEVIEENGKILLTGHMMRKTGHHLAFEKNNQVLAIFQSPYAYVSAGWYDNPLSGSTVNYMAVHAKGNIYFTDREGTYKMIKQITDKHIGPDSPASFSRLPKEYIDNMIKAIVGFRIEIVSMEAVFKLSQNKHEADRRNIISKLEERNGLGDIFIANEMKKRVS